MRSYSRTIVLVIIAILSLCLSNNSVAQVSFEVSNLFGQQGSLINIPVSLRATTTTPIDSISFTVQYDNSLIHVYDYSFIGTSLSNATNIVNIRAGAGNAVSIRSNGRFTASGASQLIVLRAKIVGSGSNSSGLNILNGRYNQLVGISTATRSMSFSPGEPIRITIADLQASTEKNVEIPVHVNDITNSGIYSYRFEIAYPSSLLDVTGVSIQGTLSQGGQIVTNTNTPGRVIVVYAKATPLTGPGLLFRILGKTKANNGAGNITFEEYRLNSGFPLFERSNGRVTVHTGTSIDDGTQLQPSSYRLVQPYPNPFNPTTVIPFELRSSGDVFITVIDSVGRTVDVLVQGRLTAGRHEIQWNAGSLPSGVYVIRMDAGGEVHTQKVTLLK